MDFDKIYGHDGIKSVLINSVKASRINHAYIFEGQAGVGRLSAALAFSKAILCENKQGGLPCGVCKSCTMAEALSHPDIRIVSNELYDESSTSKDILVGTIREMKKEIYIKPFYSERKIYIVPKAETINETAQNSLLKVFEEPPEYCTVILITDNINAFLPTILSRAVNISFNALPRETVEKYLMDNFSASEEIIKTKSAMSEGSIGNAISLMSDEKADSDRNLIINEICRLSSSSGKNLYDIIKSLKGFSQNPEFMMKIITMWFRDCLYFMQGGEIVNLDKQNELEKFCGSMTKDAPFHLLDIAVRYTRYIKQRGRFSLLVNCMLLECWEVLYDRDNWNKI